MNGPMAESTENVAELPEVDIETFDCFLAHVYSASVPRRGQDIRIEGHQPFHKHVMRSKIIEVLLAEDHKQFCCKTCGNPSQLKFSVSFPYCPGCIEKRTTDSYWRDLCIVRSCQNRGQYMDGLFCNSCWCKLKVTGTADPYDHFQSSLKGLAAFRFDVPMRALDLAEVMTERLGALHLCFMNLIAIGRLAVFADIYKALELLEHIVIALYHKMATAACEQDDVDIFIDLAIVVYSGTPSADADTPYEDRHVLQRLVSEYIAVHLPKFVKPPSLERMASFESNLLSDVLVAVARRHESDLV